MVNPIRFEQMVSLARFESGRDGKMLKIARYYKSDYIAVQMIKTFFLTSIGLVLVIGLFAAGNMNMILDSIDNWNLTVVAAVMLIAYILILAAYLAVTYLTASRRWNRARKIAEIYEKKLRELEMTGSSVTVPAGKKKRKGS
ncbi:MAG: hypothetical protein SOH48_00130 [Eubacteriales bacterium]|jgi:hypothetical protein